MDFESTKINEISKWFFLCVRVSMGILELLYVGNFMLTGQRLCSGSNFFKIVKGITLHWVLASVLYETGIPIINQSEFSFLNWWIFTEFRILIVSIRKS